VRKLGAGALVVVGLLMLGQSLTNLGLPLSIVISAGAIGHLSRTLLILTFAPALATAVFGVLLIGMRRTLSRLWFDEAPVDVALEPVQLLRLGVIIIGLALLGQGILGVLQSLSSWAQGIAFGGALPAQALLGTLYTALPRFLILLVGAALIRWSAPVASRFWSGSTTSAAPAEVHGATCPSCGAPYDPADYRPGVERKCEMCGEPLAGGA